MRVATTIFACLSVISMTSQAAGEEAASASLVTSGTPVLTSGLNAFGINDQNAISAPKSIYATLGSQTFPAAARGELLIATNDPALSAVRSATAYAMPAREFELPPQNGLRPPNDTQVFTPFDVRTRRVQPARPFTDYLLTAVVGLMLVVYQLCRKHRVLSPRPFNH